jgi:hypothetical protein
MTALDALREHAPTGGGVSEQRVTHTTTIPLDSEEYLLFAVLIQI